MTMKNLRKEHWSDCLTSKDARWASICDTTIGGKLRDCPKCWGKPLRSTGYNYQGLASYPNATILNMRSITRTETSWTHTKRNMVHTMCDRSRTRSFWVATRHACHKGVTVLKYKAICQPVHKSYRDMQMWRHKARNETERKKINIRNHAMELIQSYTNLNAEIH